MNTSLTFPSIARRVAMLAAVTALTALATALAGCAAATPVNYEEGRNWTIPMVAPLDNAEVVVPVTIHGQGPFLFMMAPDEPVSIIDRGLATSLELYSRSNSWVNFSTGSDKLVRRRPYEVLNFSAGELDVRNVVMYSTPAGSLQFGGRPLHGILGGDLLTRTIVIEIDRDRGVVQLSLTGHESQLMAAHRIKGRVYKRSNPRRKLVVPAEIDGRQPVELAVDLAAPHTTLRSKYGQEVGTLTMAGASVAVISFEPFTDRRVDRDEFQGLLGQDVLSRYRVLYDPDDRELSLAPRATDVAALTAERLRRWGDAFARCQVPGCARVTADPGGLTIWRDQAGPAGTYEVVIQPLNSAGNAIPRATLRVTLNPEKRAVRIADPHAVPGNAASFRIIDASLHVPRCTTARCFAATNRPRVALAD
ncbi:MAG: hypothetical protein AAGC55_00665 [Myxococcota bacterium]